MSEGKAAFFTPAPHRTCPAGMSNAPTSQLARERAERWGHEHPGPIIASALETLLRGLLAANGRRDADARVVEGVRALVGASWAAIFEEQEEGIWICRGASGDGPPPGASCRVAPADSPHDVAEILSSRVDATAAGFGASIPLDPGTAVLLLGPPIGGARHSERSRRTVQQVIPDLALTLRRGDELDTLRSQAFVDALTDCYNRRGFDEHLHVELHRAQRYERTAALMLVDLDGFKEINDKLGHQAGDHVLRRFAEVLRGTFRNTDVVCRYGGDEFAVIFPETTRSEAVRLAQRVRSILGRTFPDRVIPRRVTASFGIAAYPVDSDNPGDLIASADRALYAAKIAGRDRVMAASVMPPRTAT